MRRGAIASRRHIELPWISLGVGNELGNGSRRNQWMDHHHVWHTEDRRDGRDIADKIEIELFVERRIDSVCRSDQEERVAVRRRTHHRLGADITAGTRSIIDDEWRAE